MNKLTENEIKLWAVDDASFKRAQKLKNPDKWWYFAKNEENNVIWGEIEGSDPAPYQVQIDLGSENTGCSCPSRQTPCKHTLGLLLVYANAADRFKDEELPDWVDPDNYYDDGWE